MADNKDVLREEMLDEAEVGAQQLLGSAAVVLHAPTNWRVRRRAASSWITRRTGRSADANADKGSSYKAAVSKATSAASVSSVWKARSPAAVIVRPCSRVSSRISGRMWESGGKMLGTCSTSESRNGLTTSTRRT
eukprot:6214372-Pleurochrysis_carterae.AAC.2